MRDIVLIAAENHPECIDKAALRGGRFTEKLIFEYPDQDGIACFIEAWKKKSPAPFELALTAQNIAKAIGNNSSIATVTAILQESGNRMISRNASDDATVQLCDLNAAIKTIKG